MWLVGCESEAMSSVLTPIICRAARSFLGWTQEDLCQRSGVSLRSLTRFENGDHQASAKVRDKLYDAFRNADLQFVAANTDGPELDGVGIRWRPKLPHNGIKVL
ncbi:MAG: helix-turn-helix domain-containing protein [Rhizobium sp.]|nr:helix-turn-helix domain-containing protein [Rhizobium sp.]